MNDLMGKIRSEIDEGQPVGYCLIYIHQGSGRMFAETNVNQDCIQQFIQMALDTMKEKDGDMMLDLGPCPPTKGLVQ